MSWLSVRVDTDAAHAEAFADALVAAGALSASIEDADAGTDAEQAQFDEPGENARLGWTRSTLSALFDPDTDVSAAIGAAALAAGLATTPAFQSELLAEQDWVRLTQAQFDPIQISPRLWIVPSWHASPDPEAISLALDPGLAFGTGSHPTTRLCLQWLEASVAPGVSVLDYGCGSGILALAASKLGAATVVGVDIDPRAVDAARDNARKNDVTARFFDCATPVTGEFDLVVANILANPLKSLAPALVSHVRHGGQLALSGLLDTQIDEMIDIYRPHIALRVAGVHEGWACLAGTRGGAGEPV
jgi:ribosomal protein L11 methyltransferase